jgi:putative spermidine/putrescine transport system ATP-binding protein
LALAGINGGAPLVEIRDVTKRFGAGGGAAAFTAVDRVSLDIRAGEFFSLLGPSGCGKTTLLRLLAGFETPTEGSIHIGGRDVTPLPPYLRPVNMVFQHYALFPHLSVAKNVGFGLRYQKIGGAEAAGRIEEALSRVQLPGLGHRYPHQLSGGQRQRVALARALVLRPQVLLLDEPLGALDQKLRREMQVELKHLQRTLGITFVFVTHDQEEALTMSDRIAVMNAGRVEQVDAAAAVFETPRTEFVAKFMGAANFFTEQRDGRHARFLVRPEKLRLSAAPPADGSAWIEVSVEERVYQGLSTVWTVRNDAGERYAVYRQNTEPPAGAGGLELKAGSRAYLCWQPRHAVELASDTNPGSG